jgi:ParB family chromosome partitioning protein
METAASLTLVKSSVPLKRTLDLPNSEAGEVAIPDGQFWVRVDETRADSEQPRQWFDPTEMAIFAAGLSEYGQMNPAWIRRIADPNDLKHKYEIIDGERRWRACKLNGTSHLLAVFKRPKDKMEQFQQQVIANFGRADHPPLEIARSIEKLRQMPELANLAYSAQMQALTSVFCQSVTWVLYHHSLLKLHPKIQNRLDPAIPKKQRMKMVMAVYLATIDNQATQLRIADKAVTAQMSVKQARNYARILASQEGVSIGLSRRTPTDDFRPFMTFLRRWREDSELYLTMPQGSFEAMFRYRESSEIDEILKAMKARISEATRLESRIKAAIKRRQ